jgi:hypothetical protein
MRRSLSGSVDDQPAPDIVAAALLSRHTIVALRSIIAANVRPALQSKPVQDMRSIAAAAVTSRPELLVEALALVIHACPDGAVVASGLRKLAFDEYVKNCDTDNLVRLLELETNASVAAHQSHAPPAAVSGAFSLCVSVLGNPDDLSDEQVNPDVELVLIESVSAANAQGSLPLSHRRPQVLGVCKHSLDAAVEESWRVALQSFRAWMRMPQEIKAQCRPFARRADLIISRLIMMRQTHAAQRVATSVPSRLPVAVVVTLASQALIGLPKNLDSPCISLAPRTGACMPATTAKKIGEAKALQTSPADYAQRVDEIASAFFFADAPSAALCLSILGIMPPSLSSKHALEIANLHGSKLVYVCCFARQ